MRPLNILCLVSILCLKGKGGLINSKWVMIMDFARIKKEYGSLKIRVLDHVTYMYFLAFFIDKGNPRKIGMIRAENWRPENHSMTIQTF